MRFEGQQVIVTGGASGIGRAAVRQFLAEGATVAFFDFDADKGSTAALEISAETGVNRVHFYAVDVSDGPQVQSVIARVADDLGPISVLVNNAGIGIGGNTIEISLEDWRRTFDVNLDGVFNCCRSIIPHMRENGGGTIVNTASIAGFAVEYNFAAYNASKGAVIALTRSLALDHIRENIRVNCVCPGLVSSPATAFMRDQFPDYWDRLSEDYPRGQAASPEEMAKVIAFLASADSAALVGSAVVADGGMTAWSGQASLRRFIVQAPV